MNTKNLLLSSVVFLIIIGIAFSCKKDKEKPSVNTPVYGTVSGTVLSVNQTPIGGAKVFVDFNGEIILVTSDKEGKFVLSVPSGERVVNIQTGKGNIFRSDYLVTVLANQTVVLPSEKTTLNQVAPLAFIRGYYDQIEDIIVDSLGYTATELTISDLDNLSTLMNYTGIFLNCGKSAMLNQQKYNNLKQFVENGGSLYTSDWAVEYLTGDGYNKSGLFKTDRGEIAVNQLKSCIGLNGGFVPDSLLCTQKSGPATTIYNADIVATDLQSYIGQTNLDVEYDLSQWEVINVCLSPFEVLINDPVTYGPLAVRIHTGNLGWGSGNKNTTEQGWITICHYPPGNPANVQTITVSINSWPAHQAHGDSQGACTGLGGTIYYTTFHNHAQGTISQDVQKMLEYFILNL